MKIKTLTATILIAFSLNSISQTLYVPGGITRIRNNITNSNVGIGIAIPLAKLDVRGSIYMPTGNSYWIGATSDTGTRLRLYNNGTHAYIDYYQNLFFRSGSSNSSSVNLTMTSDGKVGIGTTNPQALFEISKTGNFCDQTYNRYIRFYTDKQANYKTQCIDYEAIETSTGIIQFINPAGYGAHLMVSYISGFKGSSPGNKTWQIRESGDAFFDGKITAKEIEVKANVWADYVFKKDYKLLSIPELESFIKDNNRLPDVPSETEAKEKGVNVGDMNALLLKKVEELTLYTIQQQKEIEALKNDIRSLKK